jgi:hypothetical protein
MYKHRKTEANDHTYSEPEISHPGTDVAGDANALVCADGQTVAFL